MATRSFIARYNPDTEDYTAIYCHWDGYPTGVGATLKDNYSTSASVDALMKLGDISSLRDTLAETMTEAYPAFRGDTDVDAKSFRWKSDMIDYYRNMSCEYGYIWQMTNWQCFGLDPREIDLYR